MGNTSNYTECRIRWLDDKTEMDVTIKATHDVCEDDDNIFFYGMSREKCIKAMKNEEHCENEWQIVEVY